MILSVDEDSESAANIANSDLTDILNRNSDNCDILLPVREPWKPLAEDDTEDEDHSDHRQSGMNLERKNQRTKK
ncbi:unnamed protein product [Xylocopa violacea]|uniref:Uncharacterized protein n=1 Tax=Xylocopa violacea TaxID=135666 RepID=A0ABP1P8C2_XYLVO